VISTIHVTSFRDLIMLILQSLFAITRTRFGPTEYPTHGRLAFVCTEFRLTFESEDHTYTEAMK